MPVVPLMLIGDTFGLQVCTVIRLPKFGPL
jgi:hypothetical protein